MFFIFGVARGGTNLIAGMLDRHPEAAVALDPLMPLFKSLRNATLNNAGIAFDPDGPFSDYYGTELGVSQMKAVLGATLDVPVCGDARQLVSAISGRAALESGEVASVLANINGATYRGLILDAFRTMRRLRRKPLVGVKEVWTLDFLPALSRAFPTAKFIYIERDPRAVLASMLTLGRKDPTQLAHGPSYLRHWRKNATLAKAFSRYPLLKISYESLVLNPRETLAGVCDHLGIGFTEEMLIPVRPPNTSYDAPSLDRWKAVLTKDEIGACDFMCWPEIAWGDHRFGRDELPLKTLNFMLQCDKQPVRWRSDGGDVIAAYGLEAARRIIKMDSPLAERCFLVPSLFCV